MSSAANHRKRSHRSEYINSHSAGLVARQRKIIGSAHKEQSFMRRLFNKNNKRRVSNEQHF